MAVKDSDESYKTLTIDQNASENSDRARQRAIPILPEANDEASNARKGGNEGQPDIGEHIHQISDLLHKNRCSRQSLMNGIGFGFGIGLLRYYRRPNILIACNWAIGGFLIVGGVSWPICVSTSLKRLRQQQEQQSKIVQNSPYKGIYGQASSAYQKISPQTDPPSSPADMLRPLSKNLTNSGSKPEGSN